MDSNTNTSGEIDKQPYPLLTASVRPDQWEWIEAERIRQRHGNRSRVIQEALDSYRESIEVRQRMGRIA